MHSYIFTLHQILNLNKQTFMRNFPICSSERISEITLTHSASGIMRSYSPAMSKSYGTEPIVTCTEQQLLLSHLHIDRTLYTSQVSFWADLDDTHDQCDTS